MVKFTSLAVRALFALTTVIISPTIADSNGSYLWKPVADNEVNNYARVIELQHAGGMNGKLLATWEHHYAIGQKYNTANGTAGNFIIRESGDQGKSWTTLATVKDPQTSSGHPAAYFWQPFLFEFPQKLGKYPAGTILLVGNISPVKQSTEFFSWRSMDHGKTWDPVGVWQRGSTNGTGGIWEPFLYMDSRDRLVAVFSDDRQQSKHSQMLVHVVSEDGGDTWGDVVPDVVSPYQKDRPGMATVAKMDNGEYIMSYEFCPPPCHIHVKTSKDGFNWNASDVGTAVSTADGISAGSSPYVVWDPSMKHLVLASHVEWDVGTTTFGPELQRIVYINKNYGKGEWLWAPAPWSVSNASSECTSNYSPNLLPLSDGVIRYTAPASEGSTGLCSERTGQAPIGVLPYKANFTANGQLGWIDFGGNWSVSGGQHGFAPIANTDAVAVTGSSGWTDYQISADVMITGKSGVAGLSARVTASKTGLNSLRRYTAAINSATGNLTISREADAQTIMHSQAHPRGIQGNKWYHMSFAVKADKLTVTLTGEQGGSNISFTSIDGTFAQGMTGLFGKNGGGSFKDVQITGLT